MWTKPIATSARQRVRAIRGFYTHLIVYTLVNTGLFLINILTWPGNWWFFWPLLGWGIALAAHALFVFGVGGWLGNDWKERETRKIREAAEMLSIGHLLDRKPKALSGGQRQRVALGRAIVRNPAVFLMDEPLSNLDAKLRVQTRSEISKLHQRLKTTFVYVIHDQTEALTMGSHIAVMNDGIVQQLDTPQVLYDRPANMFVAGFIGSPAMNFFEAKLDRRDGSAVVDIGSFQLPLPQQKLEALGSHIGKAIYFGIRPEDIHDAQHVPRGVDEAAKLSANVTVVEPHYANDDPQNSVDPLFSMLGFGTTPHCLRIRSRPCYIRSL